MKLSLLSLLIISVAGCQQAAALPTPTPRPTATVTSVPPTLTATGIPSTPTLSPTPLPPIPTADFTLADILGIWTRSDPERGGLFLTLNEGGSYLASHGSPAGVVHAGAFTLDGRLFTFVDGWDCSPLPDDTQGAYVIRLGSGGQWIFLDLYEDNCHDRPAALARFRWTRYVPTPTPSP